MYRAPFLDSTPAIQQDFVHYWRHGRVWWQKPHQKATDVQGWQVNSGHGGGREVYPGEPALPKSNEWHIVASGQLKRTQYSQISTKRVYCIGFSLENIVWGMCLRDRLMFSNKLACSGRKYFLLSTYNAVLRTLSGILAKTSVLQSVLCAPFLV